MREHHITPEGMETARVVCTRKQAAGKAALLMQFPYLLFILIVESRNPLHSWLFLIMMLLKTLSYSPVTSGCHNPPSPGHTQVCRDEPCPRERLKNNNKKLHSLRLQSRLAS